MIDPAYASRIIVHSCCLDMIHSMTQGMILQGPRYVSTHVVCLSVPKNDLLDISLSVLKQAP